MEYICNNCRNNKKNSMKSNDNNENNTVNNRLNLIENKLESLNNLDVLIKVLHFCIQFLCKISNFYFLIFFELFLFVRFCHY